MPGVQYVIIMCVINTLANKLMLKKQYFQTEMKEDTSIEVHMKYMKELTVELLSLRKTK